MKKEDDDSLASEIPGEFDIKALLPKAVNVESQDDKYLRKFLDIVERNIKNKELKNDFFSQKMLESTSTIKRKLKRITEMTPWQLVHAYRLERGKQLLEKDVGNVTEIAEMVGFSEQPNFSKYFKKRFGQSPKEYQEECKKKAAQTAGGMPEKPTGNRNHRKRMSLHLELELDELDRGYISKVIATKADGMYDFEDKEGTPQREETMQAIQLVYDPPLSLASDHSLTIGSLKQLLKIINKKINKLNKKVRDMMHFTGYTNQRFELFEIEEERVRRNALSVSAVCMEEELRPTGSSNFELNTKHYGNTFNLCDGEPFSRQPTAAGYMNTAVLVNDDVVATSVDRVNEKNMNRLRFVFGYAFARSRNTIAPIPADNIYKAVEILPSHHLGGGEWVLVRLHRKVNGREAVIISGNPLKEGLPVYVMGHPNGLPFKYAPGISIEDIQDNHFTAPLDIYSGGKGSPVFCARTHELLGIVTRAHTPDFRWTGSCWVTFRYPKSGHHYRGAQIAKSTEFHEFI